MCIYIYIYVTYIYVYIYIYIYMHISVCLSQQEFYFIHEIMIISIHKGKQSVFHIIHEITTTRAENSRVLLRAAHSLIRHMGWGGFD